MICDGYRQCDQGEDEQWQYCPCKGYQFKCSDFNSTSSKCVYLRDACDGFPDCIDSSDEEFCQQPCPAGTMRYENTVHMDHRKWHCY